MDAQDIQAFVEPTDWSSGATLEPLRLVTKQEVHELGLLHTSSHLLILDGLGRILARKRSNEELRYPDLWTTTVGTHVLVGDTYESTVSPSAPIQPPYEYVGEFRVKDDYENEVNGLHIVTVHEGALPTDFMTDRQFLTEEQLATEIRHNAATPHLAAAYALLKETAPPPAATPITIPSEPPEEEPGVDEPEEVETDTPAAETPESAATPVVQEEPGNEAAETQIPLPEPANVEIVETPTVAPEASKPITPQPTAAGSEPAGKPKSVQDTGIPGVPAAVAALTPVELKAAAALYAKRNQKSLSHKGVQARQQTAQKNLSAITAYIASHSPTTNASIARALNLPPRRVSHYMQILTKQGTVTATGWAQSRRYYAA